MYEYILKEEGINPLFTFITKNNTTYTVSFYNDNYGSQFFENLHQITFTRNSDLQDEKDIAISYTIIAIITTFLAEKPNALLCYICDSMDGRNKYRSRLFAKWHKNSPNKYYEKLVIDYEDLFQLEFIFNLNYYLVDELKNEISTTLTEFSTHK